MRSCSSKRFRNTSAHSKFSKDCKHKYIWAKIRFRYSPLDVPLCSKQTLISEFHYVVLSVYGPLLRLFGTDCSLTEINCVWRKIKIQSKKSDNNKNKCLDQRNFMLKLQRRDRIYFYIQPTLIIEIWYLHCNKA